MTETLTNGYLSERTQQELYLMNTNMTGFRWFPNILYLLDLWTKVSLELGGLRINGLIHEDKQVSVCSTIIWPYLIVWGPSCMTLTLSMLRILSYKAQGWKVFWKPSRSCHVGIHWKAFTEYSHMSTHVAGFQSFFRIFASFCIGQIGHQQHKG